MWATRKKEMFRLLRKSAPTRCPYCHDDLNSEEEVWHCENCLTTVHDECRAELNRCPTCNTGPNEFKWISGIAFGRDVHIKYTGGTAIGRDMVLDSNLPPGVKLVGAACEWYHRTFTDYTGRGLCQKCTKTCECGKPITQKGEFRCYECWDVDTETAFPSSSFWPDDLSAIVVIVVPIILIILGIWKWWAS